MKQEIISRALSIIQARRRTAESEYSNILSPLYEDENFVELNKKYTRLVIENARKEANGEPFDKNEELKLKTELDKLKNHATPNYSCKICDDVGYVNGHMCKCLKKEISSILLAGSGFDKLEKFEEAMKTSGQLLPTYHLMQKWCNSDFKKTLIYLSGPTGVGKTYLVRAMANDLIERGKVVRIVTAFAMNQDFKEFSKKHNDELLNKYIDCEVLFIDDLGTEPLYKNVTLEYLYLVINERKMRKLPTIITSNLDLGDIIERYDERISSRIVDRETSITILLQGNDRRIKN